MSDVNEIIRLMGTVSAADTQLVTEAFAFAQHAHKDHTRISGEPYFNHLYETARGLAEIGMGAQTVAAGLLHDSIEDVGVSPETIEEKFGADVRFLVEGVTKLGSLKYRGVERHVESLRKLFVATSQDVRVIIIKLFDRLHNMKTLEHVPASKRRRIALETLEIYAPIADRLGMGRLKRELEDYAFPYLDAEAYAETKSLLAERTKQSAEILERSSKSLKKKLAAEGIVTFRTESRIKGLYSLHKKIERHGGETTKIYDVIAIRIIVPSVSDCYRSLGVVHALWRPLPGKIKDYIAFPKPNGYQSLHTTVFTGDGDIIEVQIRTEDMHREAQWGIASHFAYKQRAHGKSPSGANLSWLWQLLPGKRAHRPNADAQNGKADDIPTWIRQVAQAQQTEPQNDEFMTELRGDFFSHRVFVFTPKGDVIDLPIDSSPIDFAYSIHSDIGNHMAGAKVNGKLVSLDTRLKNGDIVEIDTKQSANPTPKWLDHAKTAMAKSHIRAALAKKK
jgi:GTP pyrophosphokinase